MQPKVLFTTWITNDLTQCQIHNIDGKLVVLVPKRWEEHMLPISYDDPSKRAVMQAGNGTMVNEAGDLTVRLKDDGKPVTFRGFRVLEWETVDLKDYLLKG